MNETQERIWKELAGEEAIRQLREERLPDDEIAIDIRAGKILSRANNLVERMCASSTRPGAPRDNEFRRVPSTDLEVSPQWDMRRLAIKDHPTT